MIRLFLRFSCPGSKEPDYDEYKDQLEEMQEEESGEQETTNQVF